MSTDDWRTPVTAGDYFLHQQKRLAVDQRRPAPRTAQDLGLGPGISSGATRIEDFNNEIATFNGYYSAVSGTLNAPTPFGAFVGSVVSDPDLGGTQTFTSLDTNTDYRRTFARNPTNPSTLIWSEWTGQRTPPTCEPSATDPSSVGATEVPPNVITILRGPALIFTGRGAEYYERSNFGIKIKKPGIYTGNIQLFGNYQGAGAFLQVITPHSDGAISRIYANGIAAEYMAVPFTFATPRFAQPILQVKVLHSSAPPSGTPARKYWFLANITRVGDAY